MTWLPQSLDFSPIKVVSDELEGRVRRKYSNNENKHFRI